MFSVSFSCIIHSLLSKFIGSEKLDYGTYWSKLNKIKTELNGKKYLEYTCIK